ncbi:MAG: hypothetical protein JW873_06880 [Candidatus Saganbacteria bacterium]|nr:hypothetical protein [Candidatus Saganbacteria bacterium]
MAIVGLKNINFVRLKRAVANASDRQTLARIRDQVLRPIVYGGALGAPANEITALRIEEKETSAQGLLDEINRRMLQIQQKMGDWVPPSLQTMLADRYEEIAAITIAETDLSCRTKAISAQMNLVTVGDYLRLDKSALLVRGGLGEDELVEVIHWLSQPRKWKEAEVRQVYLRIAPKREVNDLVAAIKEILAILRPRYRLALESRYGLFVSRSGRTGEIAESLGESKSLINWRIRRSLRRLRRSKRLAAVAEKIESVRDALLAGRLIASEKQLAAALNEQGFLSAEDNRELPGIVSLLDAIFGGQRFPRVHLGKWAVTRDRLGDDVWLCRDPAEYVQISALYFAERNGPRQRAFWSVAEYQSAVLAPQGIRISEAELRLILEKSTRFTVTGKHFYASDTIGVTRDRVRKFIAANGPTHYKTLISRYGWYAYNSRPESSGLVLVAAGIYDLAEKHPELKKVPRRKAKRQSNVFNIVYAILRDAGQKLTASEIHNRILKNYAGCSWSRPAVDLVLTSAELHQGNFTGKDGRFWLSGKKR